MLPFLFFKVSIKTQKMRNIESESIFDKLQYYRSGPLKENK